MKLDTLLVSITKVDLVDGKRKKESDSVKDGFSNDIYINYIRENL